MKLQLHKITSKISEKKIAPAPNYSKSKKSNDKFLPQL